MSFQKIDLTSLGYKSDLIFNQYAGEIIDRGDYIVATTSSNPNYFWGNLLIYKSPPEKGDWIKWKQAFHNEITHPDTYHMTFGWDSPNGEHGAVDEFINDGFTLAESVVLTTDSVSLPPKYNSEVIIKLVESDEDFETTIQIQVECGGNDLSKTSLESFYRKQIELYRRLILKGKGAWFGAYINGEMVGGLGIFSEGAMGRYQIVSTHPKHQRKGVCATLVYESAKHAFSKMNISKLVMIADENYHAAKIYESVGFKPTEKLVGVNWFDKSKA